MIATDAATTAWFIAGLWMGIMFGWVVRELWHDYKENKEIEREEYGDDEEFPHR